MKKKPSFDKVIKQVEEQINGRRSKWTLSSMAFEDVAQIVLFKIFVKYDQYKPKKGIFSHWVSKVISNEIKNILRDNHTKFSRPCISGCVFNTGDDTCSKTKSGKQCEECIIYKKWKERKADHFNVAQTLPLENHFQEVNNMTTNPISSSASFVDFDHYKKIIDVKIKDKLDEKEYAIYQMLYVEGMDEIEVGKKMGYKDAGVMYPGYQQILKAKKKIIIAARKIIDEEDLTQ